MRAAVFNQVGKPWTVEVLPDPVPLAGEAIIRVGRCGICGSDLSMSAGKGPPIPCGTVLGHEYAGEVVALAPGESFLKLGDRVTALPAVGCGDCLMCRQGEPVLCARLVPYMGGFAEYMRIPVRTAVKLPDSVTMADGALVEPLAVGLHAVRMVALTPGARVLVLGAGAVGLATIFWARRSLAGRIVAMSRSRHRAALAETMGADQFVASGEGEAERTTEALGGPPDVVFECGGAPGMLSQAIGLVRTNGTVVSLGACSAPEPLVGAVCLIKQVKLLFSMAYSVEEFQFAAERLGTANFQVAAMVTSAVSLNDLPAQIVAMTNGGADGKVQLDPRLSRT
ncbi:MAG TPA: alcohol dehydrogenase catalytic domain-containing protein [Caulobacteraceae bacterium]|jgi:(R,R)-butanediol dehydrogenase/meso-butanediol dehydrogenase/diacetyl reductase